MSDGEESAAEDTAGEERERLRELARRRFDRGLTLGARGRRGTGEIEGPTKAKYAYLIRKFVPWCRSQGLSAMPASSETLAAFAQDLVEVHAVTTVRMAVTAVRWWHREHGHPAPDQLAAWYVLGVYKPQSNRATAERACPVGRGELARVLAAAGPDERQAARDHAAVLLMWRGGMGVERAAALTVGQVETDAAGVRLRLPDHVRLIEHDDHDDPVPCGACAVARWRRLLADLGARDLEPFLRQVDQHGNVDGFHPAGLPRRDVRMTAVALGRVVARLMKRADLPPELLAEVLTRPTFNLRLGGALWARQRGASRAEVAVNLGYQQDSRALLNYLMRWEAEDSSTGEGAGVGDIDRIGTEAGHIY